MNFRSFFEKVIDEGSIEEKQAFLSNWLETLSNHSIIGHSDELKDFYGYEDPLKSPGNVPTHEKSRANPIGNPIYLQTTTKRNLGLTKRLPGR